MPKLQRTNHTNEKRNSAAPFNEMDIDETALCKDDDTDDMQYYD
jgi:hypothetical protein